MAPELCHGSYNNKVDIWSLGCTLIEMVSKKMPFHEMNFENPVCDHSFLSLLLAAFMSCSTLSQYSVMFHIARGNSPTIPENVSPELRDFLRLCLTLDGAARPEAATLLNHPFVSRGIRKRPAALRLIPQPVSPIVSASESSHLSVDELPQLIRRHSSLSTVEAAELDPSMDAHAQLEEKFRSSAFHFVRGFCYN